jgi:hypothetical protein
MTVTYHSGRRIQGTQADFDGTPAVSGGWKELGRHTLGSNTAPITVSSLPDKQYYMVLRSWSGNTGLYERFNNDSGNNYSSRRAQNGNTDSTLTSQPAFPWGNAGYTSTPNFTIDYVANLAGKEKLGQRLWAMQMTAGAGTAPDRAEIAYKWANTSDAINRMDIAVGSGTLDSGSEMVVLGYDPDDTHTDNFWEQLASVTLSSAGDTINSGTITAKKYIWFQVYAEGANTELQFRLNSDSGSNYASRRSGDGGSDSTFTSQTSSKINATGGASHTACFMNGFIINNSANEKLIITHQVATEATGAGTAPRRSEGVTKWSNTSSQITSIQAINNSTGDFGTNSFIKVWGSN